MRDRSIRRKLSCWLAVIAVGVAAHQAFAAADGTLRWIGPANGGDWMDAANWAVDGSSSYSVADLLTKKTIWKIDGLADGAEISAGANQVIIAGIQWTTSSKVGSVTLSSSANCKFSGENVEINVAGGGNTLEWRLNHNNKWAGDTQGKKLIFIGNGTTRISPSVWFECYQQDLQPCNYTTVILGPNVGMPMSFVTMWNNATLKLEKNMVVGALRVTQTTCKVDLQGHTLTIAGGESAWNNANDQQFVGELTGGGEIVFAGGIRRSIGGSSGAASLSGYAGGVRVHDAELDIAATSALPAEGLPLTLNGGSVALHANTSVRDLKGDGANGKIVIDEGKTVTLTGASGTLAGGFAGKGSVVKTGTESTLTLMGANTQDGAFTVDAGEVVVKRPVAREGLVRRWSFEDPKDLGRDYGEWGVKVVSSGQVQPFATNGVANGKALYLPATGSQTCYMQVKDTRQKGYPCNAHARSYSLWLKPDYIPGNGYIYREGHWKDGGQFTLWSASGKNLICCIDNWQWSDTSNSPVIATPDLMDGRWHHVAAAYENNTLKMWYDGELKVTKTGTRTLDIWENNDYVVIGSQETGKRYVGAVDEVSIWDHALTDEEVAAEYACRKPVDPADVLPKPVCHWAFNDPADVGKDEMGAAALEKNPACGKEMALDAAADAFGGYATAYDCSFYLPKEKMPARFPRGKTPLTLSIRLANKSWWENHSLVEWGDRSIAGNSSSRFPATFRLLVDGCPRQLGVVPPNNWDPVHFAHTQAFNSSSPSRFSHIVVTYDPHTGLFRVFRNGYQEYVNDSCWVSSTGIGEGDFYLNAEAGANANGAVIDDVQIFDRALSPQEVATLTRSLETGKAGQILSPTSPVTVSAGAKLTVSGERLRARSMAGAGEVVVDAGSTFAATSWTGFSGTVSGLGLVLIAKDGAGPAEANVSCDVELEEGTLALDYKDLDTPRVKTTGVVRFPPTGTLKLVTEGARASKWCGRLFTIAACAGYEGPATTAGWTFEPTDATLDLHGRFIFKDGVLTLKMSGGGFRVTVR